MASGLVLGPATVPSSASSHADAPLVAADPQVDGTDMYAFTSPERPDTVTLVADYLLGGHGAHDHHDHDHDHSHGGHRHRHNGGHSPETVPGRGSLLSMAAAGGLAPSLVVLLGTVALGRTAFGVALVIAYGLGMAATLAAAGLLAATAGRRLPSRLRAAAGYSRVHSWTPTMTASFVVLVGIGLTIRASSGLL
ncbi:MAG: DUF4331 family protein [Catenulispora sp.]